MPKPECEIGVVGLGTMGCNLALNFADHGFPVAVYNRTAEKTREFMAREAAPGICGPAMTCRNSPGLLRQPGPLS